MTDIEIAQAHEMKKIVDVAAKAGIDEKHLELYGNYKAKPSLACGIVGNDVRSLHIDALTVGLGADKIDLGCL